ncbi:MAG TPA: hypothetical protein VGK46_02625 [Saprospiraceae bacterium]
MIIECNVWCVDTPKEQINLGLPEGDRWMPIAIDFSKVVAIKLCGENDFIGDQAPVVYVGYDQDFILDIPYMEALKLWKEAIGK